MTLSIILILLGAAVAIIGKIKSEKKVWIYLFAVLIFLLAGIQIWQTVTKEEPATKEDIISLEEKFDKMINPTYISKLFKYYPLGFIAMAVRNDSIIRKTVDINSPLKLDVDKINIWEEGNAIIIGLPKAELGTTRTTYSSSNFGFPKVPMTLEEMKNKQYYPVFGGLAVSAFTISIDSDGFICVVGFKNLQKK